MSVTAERVTVGVAAVALNAADTGGMRLNIKNGAAIVALGPSTVTTATGLEIAVSGERTIDIDPGDVLYAICATSSIVQVLRT